MNKQTSIPSETLQQPKEFNPRALEMIALASESDDSLRFEVTDIAGEQCVVAQVIDLSPEMKATFEGAGESDEPDLKRDWTTWKRELELLGGAGDTEIQAVRTGKTGRQKEIQVAFFGLHNAEELKHAMDELNDLRKQDGIVPEDGLPEDIAYLPINLLVATRIMRENSAEDIQRINSAQNAARNAGALALGGIASKLASK
jgi:hypothetical protein